MKRYDFPTILKGDTFKEREVTITNLVTNLPKDLTGCEIFCEFRKKVKTGELVKRLEIGDGLVLSDPTNGKFTIDKFDVNWDVDIYFYDFQFNFEDGVKETYFGGQMKVEQDVTVNN